MELPHNAHAQSKIGKRVRLRDLQPGDLVFYNTRNRGARAWSATNDSYSH